MTKKEYMKPTMRTVELKHRTKILTVSVDENGMNKKLQDQEVDYAIQTDTVIQQSLSPLCREE